MKVALGTIAGLLVSLGMFCFGAILATLLKVDPPRELNQTDVSDLCTDQPQKPAAETRDLIRLPPSQVTPSSVNEPDDPVVDRTTTASVATEVEMLRQVELTCRMVP